ncbi:thioredoxin family protein [Ferruginibacter lapsinanis]|uniref:thioredoxin family protein n=1 Tax=Ferruginibacter lapsinanis TaxID=563172 RepID=UPI001E5E5930|nr:thioredoxin family protein [Ferruginibacter lapsinanis]UEG48676.1 thioredoxin family protein [Ferruginibacter lapsinanis]
MRKLLTVVLCFITLSMFAQEKPVQFSFTTATDTAGKQVLLIKATIAKGAKLLSTQKIDGLDDVRTAINFDSTSRLRIKGDPIAITSSITEKSTALGGVSIQYFTDSAIWSQEVNVVKEDSFRIKGEVLAYVLNGDEVLNFSYPISKEFVYRPKTQELTSFEKAPESSTNKSVLGWLLAGILAGLIGFLTPCVYSLVPVTVSLFLKRSKTPQQGRQSALFYAFSIVAIYTFVAILSVLFVPQSTWNAISTSWQFNLLVFALFVIFGISFLGAFEISLPSSWANKLDSKSGLGSYTGIFFMALTLVVVSFSCTGNFVASILGIAAKTNKLAAIMGMCGFGIGLALPFALFAFFPSWLKEISKPGGWQNAMKVSLGILELALAMKFLSNADVQIGKFLFSRDIYLAIWVALFAFLTVYLLGGFKMKHDSHLPKNDWDMQYIPIPRFFFALLSMAFTIYLIPGLWGAPLNKISGLLPPYGTQEYTMNAAKTDIEKNNSIKSTYVIKPVKYVNELIKNESAAAKSAGLVAFFDYDEALAAAKEQNKPLMIDFTGIVCPNCREFENRVWTMPEVMERMKNKFVVASLFEDFNQELPDAEKRYSALLGAQINTVGDKYKELSIKLTGGVSQPNYIFLYHDGSKIVDKSYGYDDVQKNGELDFVKHLDMVLDKFNKK